MCETEAVRRLYSNVLDENIERFHVRIPDIRTGIQNMKEVYKPNPTSLSSAIVDVANYNDASHRCAYLHKYAPFHTALVAEMLQRAILENPKLFSDLITKYGRLNICSLGGGPGSDVIGALAVLNANYGFFQVSATIVDCMGNWSRTFDSLIQELRYGAYGDLGECMGEQYFDWSYLEHNLLGKMTDQVHRAIATANILTMIKFVSASASKDTSSMIQKIFRTMRPGSLLLYIDNAGGGFHQLVRKEAINCNFITVFGPLKHEHYINHNFNVKRYGYTPCLETKVSVHMWRKPSESQPPNIIDLPILQLNINVLQPQTNQNQQVKVPGKAHAEGSNRNISGKVNPPTGVPHNPQAALSHMDWKRREIYSQGTTYFDSRGRRVPATASERYIETRRTGTVHNPPQRTSANRPYIQTQPQNNTTYSSEPEDRDDNNDCSCCVIS